MIKEISSRIHHYKAKITQCALWCVHVSISYNYVWGLLILEYATLPTIPTQLLSGSFFVWWPFTICIYDWPVSRSPLCMHAGRHSAKCILAGEDPYPKKPVTPALVESGSEWSTSNDDCLSVSVCEAFFFNNYCLTDHYTDHPHLHPSAYVCFFPLIPFFSLYV